MAGNSDLMHGISMEKYVAALAQEGILIIPGPGKTFWQRSEMRSLERVPLWCVENPSLPDVKATLRRYRAVAATYVCRPDALHPPNALFYVCENQEYAMEGLKRLARKNLRRAFKELRFDFLDRQEFLQKGVVPYCETRARIGLSDGTVEAFRGRFEAASANPACKIVGAWRGDALAGFLVLTVVEDWVTTAAFGSATEYLSFRPNDGLVHFALDYYLKQHKFRLVSCGLSSIQEDDKALTLDRFKRNVGFEARPVHRAFVLHPLLQPFANSLTLWGLRTSLRAWPSSRVLRKASGLLATYLGKNPALVEAREEDREEREEQG